MAGEAFWCEDREFVALHDTFLQASSDRDWEACARIRQDIEAIWPRAFEQPYVPQCDGTSMSPASFNNKPQGTRHRWMFYPQFGDERCERCGCQRPLPNPRTAAHE
jgi:hypothetical protein